MTKLLQHVQAPERMRDYLDTSINNTHVTTPRMFSNEGRRAKCHRCQATAWYTSTQPELGQPTPAPKATKAKQSRALLNATRCSRACAHTASSTVGPFSGKPNKTKIFNNATQHPPDSIQKLTADRCGPRHTAQSQHVKQRPTPREARAEDRSVELLIGKFEKSTSHASSPRRIGHTESQLKKAKAMRPGTFWWRYAHTAASSTTTNGRQRCPQGSCTQASHKSFDSTQNIRPGRGDDVSRSIRTDVSGP